MDTSADYLTNVMVQSTNTDTPGPAGPIDSKKLADWEELNADVILLTDDIKKKSSEEWLKALQSLPHIKVYTNLKLVCVSPSCSKKTVKCLIECIKWHPYGRHRNYLYIHSVRYYLRYYLVEPTL